MCGIAGFISPYTSLVQPQKVQTMMNTLRHRGPDGEGLWINENHTVCLGHRRLAIIDTSDAASQPFHYKQFTLTFNGEIYNYIELKEILLKQGYTFSTSSDSEVIPAAYDYWGKDCLHHFDGMFAFALYDNNNKELWLARDRFGEKPLYYQTIYQERGKFQQFVFASEMKALWAIGIRKELNGTMMLNYLTLGLTQNPIKQTQTFYSNILSLPPSHYLTVQPEKGRVQMKKWYQLPNSSISPTSGDRGRNEKEVIEEFKELFLSSIKRRLRSDVLLGTSLSGGLDSTSIAATLLSNNTTSLNTFSAVFPGFSQDESAYIHDFQAHYKASTFNSHFITPTTDDWIDNWDLLMYHQEEPIQSSSVLTQFIVYRLAKEKGVTVLLDGQGTDEILGGYKKYTHWFLQQELQRDYQNFLREKKLFRQNDFLEKWDFRNYIASYFPERTALQLQKKAITQQKNLPFINQDFLGKYQNVDTLHKPVVKTIESLLYYNTFTQGLQELLRYADRNSMANSREVRLPFLDHQLVEFIFALPTCYKMRDGFTKWILRKSMEDRLPTSIAWRKGKVGYEPPQQTWMQHPLIIEKIHESRKKLVDKNILDASILKTTTESKSAHAANNNDWRIMSAAAIL